MHCELCHLFVFSVPVGVEVLAPSNASILMESCNSVKTTEPISSSEGSTATSLMENKGCDSSENLESDPVGVEFTAPRNVAVSTESCSSFNPTEMLSSTEGSTATNQLEIKPSEILQSDPVGVQVSAAGNDSIKIESCNSVITAEPILSSEGHTVTCDFGENSESDPVGVDVSASSNATVSMESCTSVKLAEPVSSTESGIAASINVMEIKPCDLGENLVSGPVGVEVSAPSNASVLIESCNSTEPTEPEVFETRKVLVTPFAPVQLSLLKLASTKVPKVCKIKSRETAVERKVVINPHGLTVLVCLKPKPASANADRVPQLDSFLNREATATTTGEGKSNRVDRQAAGVLLSVPQQSSFAPVRNMDQHYQRNRKIQARSKANAATWPSNSVNKSAVSYPARLYMSAFQPLMASVPATNTSAKSGCLSKPQRKRRNRAMRQLNGISNAACNSGVKIADSVELLPAFQPLTASVPATNTSVKSGRLSKSQRQKRNRRLRRLNGISNAAGSSGVKVADSVELLPSLLQSTTLGSCTGNCESAKYSCEWWMENRRQASGISDKSTPSEQTCVDIRSPPHVEITSTKGVSVTQTICRKMTLRPRCPDTSSSIAPPTQDLSSTSAGRSSEDDQGIVDFTTDGPEVSQFLPELLLSAPLFTLDSDDCEITETSKTNSVRGIATSSGNSRDANNNLLSGNEVSDLKSSVPGSIERSDVTCHTALLSMIKRDEVAVTKPAAAASASVVDIPVDSNGNATISQGKSLSSFLLPSCSVSVSRNGLNSQTENLTLKSAANSQTLPLLPGTVGVGRAERKRKYSQTGLSPSDAIVIDDKDDEDIDGVDDRETQTTDAHSHLEGIPLFFQASSAGSNQCKVSYLYVLIVVFIIHPLTTGGGLV